MSRNFIERAVNLTPVAVFPYGSMLIAGLPQGTTGDHKQGVTVRFDVLEAVGQKVPLIRHGRDGQEDIGYVVLLGEEATPDPQGRRAPNGEELWVARRVFGLESKFRGSPLTWADRKELPKYFDAAHKGTFRGVCEVRTLVSGDTYVAYSKGIAIVGVDEKDNAFKDLKVLPELSATPVETPTELLTVPPGGWAKADLIDCGDEPFVMVMPVRRVIGAGTDSVEAKNSYGSLGRAPTTDNTAPLLPFGMTGGKIICGYADTSEGSGICCIDLPWKFGWINGKGGFRTLPVEGLTVICNRVTMKRSSSGSRWIVSKVADDSFHFQKPADWEDFKKKALARKNAKAEGGKPASDKKAEGGEEAANKADVAKGDAKKSPKEKKQRARKPKADELAADTTSGSGAADVVPTTDETSDVNGTQPRPHFDVSSNGDSTSSGAPATPVEATK